jgi:Flp pilus assembly pilin Flp
VTPPIPVPDHARPAARRLTGDRGATLAEYAILVGVIIVAVIAITTVLAAMGPG